MNSVFGEPSEKQPWLLVLVLVAVTVLFTAAGASAACYQTQAAADAAGVTTVRISGSIYTGAMDATTLLPMPAPAAGAVSNATVMVQNMEEGGAFECYAKVTGNTYEAFVPEGEEFIVMFSAPDHDVTSREFIIPLGTAAGIAAGSVAATDFIQDAFLPPRDPVTGELPRGNLLVYAFDDRYVNSEDDYPVDPALAGVHFYVFDDEGNFEDDGISGQSPTLPPFAGPDPAGLYYFTNLPSGEHVVMALPPGVSPEIDPVTNLPKLNCQIDPVSSGWFWLTSEEGTQCWEVILRPNDPGTLLGGYIPWFGFVRHMGQLPPYTAPADNPTAPNPTVTISGTLWDADGTDPAEVIDPHEVPQICKYDHQGTLFVDYTTGYHPDQGRMDPANPGEDCVWPNINMDRGYVILWDQNAVIPGPVATTLADPVTGAYQFDNVPPGNYKMFTVDWPDDYIWQETQVTVQPGVNITNADFYIPRFFARVNGYVINDTTGARLNGIKVNMRTKDGGVWKSETTAPGTSGVNGEPLQPGYYNFDELAEIEVMAHIDVDYHTLPSNLMGVQDTQTVCYPDPASTPAAPLPDICGNFDLSSRDIAWFTANYRANLHVQEIPATEGYIIGSVFNDHLTYDAVTHTWHGNGVLDEKEDRLLSGVTVNLVDPATNKVVATTTTGTYVEDRAVAQGLIRPYTPKGFILAPEPPYNVGDIEVDEWGAIVKGPRIGQFEFRGVAPGTYRVEIVVPDGFSPSPAGSSAKTITVTGGQRNNVDFGVNTLVPLAGEIEGGVFDDVFIDHNHQSILWLEKQGIPHAPVGIYDHLGYKLGQGFMGHPYCYSPQPPASIGGPICPNAAYDTAGEPTGQKPEVERRAAPGVHVYLANDPTLPGYDSQYVPLFLNYTFGQGQFKYEADWSLLPSSFVQPLGPGAILPVGGPIIGGGIMLVKNYGPALPDGGVFRNAVFDAANPLKLLTVGDKKKEKKKKKKKHSKHKMKEKEGYKGGKERDEDHDKKDDHDQEIEGAHNENVQKGDVAVTSMPYAINGSNFGALQGHSTVSLSGQQLPVTSWSDTQIVVQIPSTAVSGPLIVATTHGISNSIHVDVPAATPDWAAYLAARMVYVDSNAMPGAGDGSQTAPYASITEALNNLPAARPVYIMVAPGTYNENVRIKDSDIKIIGSGPFASMIDGLVVSQINPLATSPQQGPYTPTTGPTFYIGAGGMSGSVSNIMISGFTITGGVPGSEGPGGGIFADYGNRNIDINNNIMSRNGGEYGGAIWLHKTNHDVRIWSNLIAENGNFGGYGGGISVNDEPEYGPAEPALDHSYDDALYSTPPGTYEIFNNLIFHNYSPDYGGGIALYEVKDQLNVYGNVIMENRSDDHGGGIFFEDTGPVELYDNVLLRNFCTDDGGAVSFEDVGDNISLVRVYNNLIAENIADDKGENSARGAGISFDDTLRAEVFNNTITGNIVAGSFDPTGGAIDSERHGHEYDAQSTAPKPPYFSDVKVYNNIMWNNYRLLYDTSGIGEDLDYRYGTNYQWSVNNIHVDNPAVNQPWQTDLNSESLSYVVNNDIEGSEYATRTGNISLDPVFAGPALLDWHLMSTSPVIGLANASKAPVYDIDLIDRTADGLADMGAMEYSPTGLSAIQVPADLLGSVEIPTFGTTQLHPPAAAPAVP